MPDIMPEDMSDRMPEDLPVTKCINVMVGITRSKVIVWPKLLHAPTLSCHTPACCNCKSLFWHEHVWIWPWVGLNWNMLLPQWEIMHQTRWSGKVAFRSRKVAVWSGKVARFVFSLRVTNSRKNTVNSSKNQFKGIPTSFANSCGKDPNDQAWA